MKRVRDDAALSRATDILLGLRALRTQSPEHGDEPCGRTESVASTNEVRTKGTDDKTEAEAPARDDGSTPPEDD
jgi:hypothetical protein